LTEAFYAWAAKNIDREKWDEFVDLTDELIAIWAMERQV
jgi:hypothetical protein